MRKPQRTSWEPASRWYNKTVGDCGHYYHQHVVIPGTLRLLNLGQSSQASLLDLACGQGVLARRLPPQIAYQGVDISLALIKAAQHQDKNPLHRYSVGDITRELSLPPNAFSHAAIILALQNIESPKSSFAAAKRHLKNDGRLVIVLNHPCFRIPRQSSWETDAQNKIQFRRINRYLSPLKIPIRVNPSQGQGSPTVWSFHQPLSAYSRWLQEEGFIIELLEEWTSDKTSAGPAARMENRSRAEFPLFLAIAARLTRCA